jgi:hypothetical protein
MDYRDIANRVTSMSKNVLEDVVVDLANNFINNFIEYFAYTVASNWDEVQYRLLEKRLEPTADNILSVLEELSDKIDVGASIENADDNTKRIVGGMLSLGIALAKRIRRDWLEKLTYENVVKQAEKRNMTELLNYLRKYPRLTSKIIDWVRERVVSQ